MLLRWYHSTATVPERLCCYGMLSVSTREDMVVVSPWHHSRACQYHGYDVARQYQRSCDTRTGARGVPEQRGR
eukprot:223293-Rhodomonas_salina.1